MVTICMTNFQKGCYFYQKKIMKYIAFITTAKYKPK